MPRECTQIVCAACGETFQRPTADVRKEAKRGRAIRYCSHECRHEGQRTRSPLTCEACGVVFLRHLSEIAKSAARACQHVYCSKTCEANGRRQGDVVERTCEWCGKRFDVQPSSIRGADKQGIGWGRFCSHPCRSAWRGDAQRSAVEVACLTCGKLHMRIPARMVERPFCSYACMGAMVHTWSDGKRYRSGMRPDVGHYCRSSWEANVARVLAALRLAYEYEPVTFRMGDIHYTPDFRVEGRYWIEVKGWMRDEAAAKIAAFRTAYPAETLVVIDKPIYDAMTREWACRLPEWESASTAKVA